MNKRPLIRNENGSVLVVSIVILALLTIIGIAVTTTSSIELQIAGNQKEATESFYRAEADLSHTEETSPTWLPLNSPLFIADPENAFYLADEDIYGDGVFDKICIRCIEDADSYVPVEIDDNDDDFSSQANRLPRIPHKDSPPPGSGYSMKHFEVRRYGITVKSEQSNSKTCLQAGVWKVFNKHQ